MVLVENVKFLYSFFLGNIGREKVFGDVLEKKLDFLHHKNIDFRKSQNMHSSKGVNPWFCSKI